MKFNFFRKKKEKDVEKIAKLLEDIIDGIKKVKKLDPDFSVTFLGSAQGLPFSFVQGTFSNIIKSYLHLVQKDENFKELMKGVVGGIDITENGSSPIHRLGNKGLMVKGDDIKNISDSDVDDIIKDMMKGLDNNES